MFDEKTNFSTGDCFKWGIAGLLLISALIANTYFMATPLPIRLVIGAVIMILIAGLSFWTTQGHSFWNFLKEARTELRKVVWPTRKETTQATTMVVVMVVITALFLWGIDSFLLWLVTLFTK